MCNLGCIFCQNWDISHRPSGQEMDAAKLADLMLALQGEGCHNINLVTPTHVAPQLIEALALAIQRGLRLPVVYNTSAYDSVDTLRLMDGLIDIYMPDFKFWSADTAQQLTAAGDYRAGRGAIRNAPAGRRAKFGPDGLACRGVLVRHLVMPAMPRASHLPLAGHRDFTGHIRKHCAYCTRLRSGPCWRRYHRAWRTLTVNTPGDRKFLPRARGRAVALGKPARV